MSKIADYQVRLRSLDPWDEFLMQESGLPGPRAHLELLEAVYREGKREFFEHCLARDAADISTDDPRVFLVMCGVAGLGKLVAAGERGYLETLREYASDPRWRVREAVAIGLQHWGDADLPGMLAALELWSGGSRFEQRAVVAAICEPRLLKQPFAQQKALALMERITQSIVAAGDRKSDGFLALKKSLGYGWSVAVAANPAVGQPFMQRWLACPDPDVSWVMRENLKKNRIKGLLWEKP